MIIPHFDKYPLITQKRADFELFKTAFEIINHQEHLTIEGLRKLVAIKTSLNWGLSSVLEAAFPGIVAYPRPEVASHASWSFN